MKNDTHYFTDIDYYASRVTAGVDFRAKILTQLKILKKFRFLCLSKSLYLQDRQQRILNSQKIIETQDDSDWEEIGNAIISFINYEKKIISIINYFFSVISVSFSIEPDVFVQSTVNRASKLLSDGISKDEKIEKLKSIAKETVDIQGIGFYTLGAKEKALPMMKRKNILNYLKYIF